MRNLLFFLPLIFLSCNDSNTPEIDNNQQIKASEIVKTDSVITLQMHVKNEERFSFGYLDDVFNFNMIETPEKPDTTVYERKIISYKPIFLKDIDVWKQNFFYLIPGETYRISQEAGFSHFEVVDNPQRTYEVNALKELRKHNKALNKFNEYDAEESYAVLAFKNMDLKFRDSLLQKNYQDNLNFLEHYASKKGFAESQKHVLTRYLFYKYNAARLNFNLKKPGKVRSYLAGNKQLYNNLLMQLDCDSCFDYPHYYFLASLFARAYVADPGKQASEDVYQKYDTFFTGKTRDYLLYDLIKFGGMFNYTKPNPVLAKQFLSTSKDPILKSYIREIYDFIKVRESPTGTLVSYSGNALTWNEMLQKHLGKVIYVDFWASWCGPCRTEMPSSRLLQKRLVGKEVVFVYISLDENGVDWKKASRLESLDQGESYIMVNPEDASLRKQFKISSIPRYFLINRSGKIVNSNALRPGDEKIAGEIESLL